MQKTDEEVMISYVKGDHQAVEILFLRYKVKILNFCFRVLGNRAEAEDVAAEVFLAIFSKKYTYQPTAKFSTWLFTIARNRCIDQIRKTKHEVSLVRKNASSGQEETWDIPDSTCLSREELVKKEEAQGVRMAIAQLAEEQRCAIVLREYHQLSYEQISQILNCSLEKVKILIFRAREQLRRDLTSFIMEEDHDR